MTQLITLLNEIRDGKDYTRSNHFFNEGLLDSLDLTTLVSSLEANYGIFVDVAEMVPDNFCNLTSIERFLTNKGVKV